MYSWGSNYYGQLGLGPHVQSSPRPQLVSAIRDTFIVDIVAGQYHSLALTASGKVFTWGWGVHGQLGHNNCDNVYIPKQLNFKMPAKLIAAGQAHSLIVTVDGKLYGFGSNFFGQVGSEGAPKIHFPIPIVLDEDKECRLETVAAAYFHNVSQN